MQTLLAILSLLDVSGGAWHEAWDVNARRESLAGIVVGSDIVAWRRVSVRSEALVVRVMQEGSDAWVRGFTIGSRVHWRQAMPRPFVDIAVGLSNATLPTPPGGTRFNYLALAGVGVELRMSAQTALIISGRWLHVSNNGRDGRTRNPDIQSLGALAGIRWER